MVEYRKSAPSPPEAGDELRPGAADLRSGGMGSPRRGGAGPGLRRPAARGCSQPRTAHLEPDLLQHMPAVVQQREFMTSRHRQPVQRCPLADDATIEAPSGRRAAFEPPVMGETKSLRRWRDVRIQGVDCSVGGIAERDGRAGGLDHRLFGPGDEPLPSRRLLRAVESRLPSDHPAGGIDRLGQPSRVQGQHHLAPDRRRAAHTGNLLHRLPAGVADPHAHGVAAGPADAPVVPHVLAGTRLDRRRERQGQRAGQAEGERPRVVVRQHVADDEAGPGVRDLTGRRALGARRPLPARQRRVGIPAAVGQRSVGVGQPQQSDVRAAQGQRGTVKAARLGQAQPEGVETFENRLRREHQRQPHRRDVEAAAQRSPRADPAAVLLVVVLRQIESSRRRDLGR